MSTRVTTKTASSEITPARFRFTLYHLSLLLVVAGLLVTGYMSYTKLAGQPLACAETGMINCSLVENSAWARVLGIPTALIGFTAHVIIGATLLLEKRVDFFRNNAVFILFGFVVFCILYHSYLIYVSVFILKALCPWCLTAASIMLGQLITTTVRMRRAMES
jgi:uncharacterized membrane protein